MTTQTKPDDVQGAKVAYLATLGTREALGRLKALITELPQSEKEWWDKLRVLVTSMTVAKKLVDDAKARIREQEEILEAREAEVTLGTAGKNEKERAAAVKKCLVEDAEYRSRKETMRTLAAGLAEVERDLEEQARWWKLAELAISRGFTPLRLELRYYEAFLDVRAAQLRFIAGGG